MAADLDRYSDVLDLLRELPTHCPDVRVVVVSGSAVTGLALSWAGWVEWLMPSFVSMDASTLMGAGGLISVLGLRWAVGHWEKAKKRWWDDWKRIYDGLERDLKVSFRFVVFGWTRS